MRVDRKIRLVVPALLAVLIAGGCSLETPSNVTDGKVELYSQEHAFKVPVSDMDEDDYEEIGTHYWRYGTGPVHVAVTYSPGSNTNTAMTASLELARVSNGLRKAGIADVRGDILPAAGDGVSMALVTYAEVTASAPRDCKRMPGMGGRSADIEEIEAYKIGCGLQDQFARQIARPKDLRGQSGTPPGDTPRASAVIEGYRAGPAAE
ncbi:MAG: hypothetical protein EOM26_03520 [Alphaproteobacteria bacterium]|nr:hypothetical protein [Alphaproteobacteria bacterium]